MDTASSAPDDGRVPNSTETLRWASLTPECVGAWAELTTVLADTDGTGETYEAEDLAEELEETGVAPETDTWAVWADDDLVAYGQLRVGLTLDVEGRVRAHLSGGVHPRWRRRGIGTALMDRMETRARALASERHPGVPAYFRAPGGAEGSDVRRLLADRGYAVARYFNDLSRPLPGPALPELPLAGATLVDQLDEYEEATRVAHNVAFADHWGSAQIPAEEWHHHWMSRSSRPALSTLALGSDRSVLAYVLAGQYVPGTVYVAIVGTVPQARGRGLAAACLARTLALAAATGDFERAELAVDSASPTGATRLYERLGFETVRTLAAMQRDMP